MISQKTIILSLILALGTNEILVKSAPTEQDRSQNIEKSVAKFNTLFAKSIKDNLKPEENVLFSPLNIYTTLAQLQLGATGETKQELSDALGIPAGETGSTAHQDLGKILNDIQTTYSAEVRIANTIFVQKGIKLKESYSKDIKNYYKNEAQQVDFAKGGSEATNIVNNWVSNNTKNRIPKLFENGISSDMKLLAASTLFFNASWKESFIKELTKEETFNTGVKNVTVDMMRKESYNWNIPYINDKKLGIKVISIPYRRGEFEMAVILPNRNKSVSAFIEDLTPDHQQQMIRDLRSESNREEVWYELPRFKFQWRQNINKEIMKSGISKIFANAELQNLVENCTEHLKVSELNHATDIQVDETGTISTATTYGMTPLSSREPEIRFHVDRPFLFWIYHRKTGVVLFTGIVQNPAA